MLSNRQIASTYKNKNHENLKPSQKGKTYKPEPEIVNKTIGTVAAGVPDRPPSNEDYIYNDVEGTNIRT